jgi:hypothetical protein
LGLNAELSLAMAAAGRSRAHRHLATHPRTAPKPPLSSPCRGHHGLSTRGVRRLL